MVFRSQILDHRKLFNTLFIECIDLFHVYDSMNVSGVELLYVVSVLIVRFFLTIIRFFLVIIKCILAVSYICEESLLLFFGLFDVLGGLLYLFSARDVLHSLLLLFFFLLFFLHFL